MKTITGRYAFASPNDGRTLVAVMLFAAPSVTATTIPPMPSARMISTLNAAPELITDFPRSSFIAPTATTSQTNAIARTTWNPLPSLQSAQRLAKRSQKMPVKRRNTAGIQSATLM